MMKPTFAYRAVPWVRFCFRRSVTERVDSSLAPRHARQQQQAVRWARRTGAAGLALLQDRALRALSVLRTSTRNSTHGSGSGGPSLLFVAPHHFGYQLLSAAAVPVGAGLYLIFDEPGRGSTTTPAVTGTRFFALAFGETGARLIAFAATAYLARRLGASAFGQIGFATAILMHFGPGLRQRREVGAREVAREPTANRRSQGLEFTSTHRRDRGNYRTLRLPHCSDWIRNGEPSLRSTALASSSRH